MSCRRCVVVVVVAKQTVCDGGERLLAFALPSSAQLARGLNVVLNILRWRCVAVQRMDSERAWRRGGVGDTLRVAL